MVKLTLETQDRKVTIEDPLNDLDIFDLGNLFRDLAHAMGYHPESVKEILPEE